MKKLILFSLWVLSWLLFSCVTPKATKNNIQQTHSEQSESEMQIDSTKIYRELAQLYRQSSEEWERKYTISQQEDFELTKTKYDTGQPVNPETGKPPVAEETKIKKKSQTDVAAQEQSILQEKLTLTTERLDSTIVGIEEKESRISELETQIETMQETGYPRWILFLTWSGGVAWVGLVVWIVVKIRGICFYTGQVRPKARSLTQSTKLAAGLQSSFEK